MTTPAEQQQPPAGQPPATGGAGQPAGRDTVEHRIEELENTQREHGTILRRIEQLLAGQGTSQQPPASQQPAGPSITQQVEEGVRQLDERRRAEEAERQWRDQVDQHLTEHAPRPPRQTTRRERLAGRLWGG